MMHRKFNFIQKRFLMGFKGDGLNRVRTLSCAKACQMFRSQQLERMGARVHIFSLLKYTVYFFLLIKHG